VTKAVPHDRAGNTAQPNAGPGAEASAATTDRCGPTHQQEWKRSVDRISNPNGRAKPMGPVGTDARGPNERGEPRERPERAGR
jgi:hypothetical protein